MAVAFLRISHFRQGFALLGATLLCACGADVPEIEDPGTTTLDPPGAALPLSIGGRAEAAGDDTYTISVNCAAALSLTAERLAQMANDPRSDEIALIGRAEKHFESQAETAQAEVDDAVTSVTAAIARQRQEKSAEITEQAQLAIACLRRFADDIGEI